jgi:hypothetical protein
MQGRFQTQAMKIGKNFGLLSPNGRKLKIIVNIKIEKKTK